MNYSQARDYMLSKPESIEDFPFGKDVAVMKVCGKMFATLSYRQGVAETNLKCEPHQALMLRDLFPAITAGYHMNKKHWNTLVLDGSIPEGELERLIDHSYTLVVAGLKKGDRLRLKLNSATTI